MKRLAESTTEYSFTTIPWSLIIPSLFILALADYDSLEKYSSLSQITNNMAHNPRWSTIIIN